MKIPVEKDLLELALFALRKSFDLLASFRNPKAAIAHNTAIKAIEELEKLLEASFGADAIHCKCGDAYHPDSYGAGFIAAAGHCPNCDTEATAIRLGFI